MGKNGSKKQVRADCTIVVCHWVGLEECSSRPGIFVSRSLSRGFGFVSLLSFEHG